MTLTVHKVRKNRSKERREQFRDRRRRESLRKPSPSLRRGNFLLSPLLRQDTRGLLDR
jgi:hypothetical protein